MLRLLIIFLLLCNFFIGCAEVEPPSPAKILSPWGGVAPARLGESKDSVKGKLGEPDSIRALGSDETGLIKEEWTYYGRYPEVPVDYKYLSKTKRLIFTGDSLTGYNDEDVQTPTSYKDKE